MDEQNGRTVIPLGEPACPICHQRAKKWTVRGRSEEIYVCENEHCKVGNFTVRREPYL
jgi:hypothetical protein